MGTFGEPLIRALLYGAHTETVDFRSETYLPSNVPQVLSGCGVRFVRVADGFPEPTFRWRGADGSTVIVTTGENPPEAFAAFPVWRGEVGQGVAHKTPTTRNAETALRNAELFCVLAEVEAGAAYPGTELRTAWQALLDGHDADAEAAAKRLLDAALAAIAERVPVKEDAVLVFNPSDTLRPSDAVRVTVPTNVVKAVEFADENDALLPTQFLSVDKKGNRDYLVLLNEVGGLGYQTITAYKSSGPPEESTVAATPDGKGMLLENDWARVRLNASGAIVSFVHKLSGDDENDPDAVIEREVIATGQRAPAETRNLSVIENGPVRAAVACTVPGNANPVKHVVLYAHSPRVEVHGAPAESDYGVAINCERAVVETPHGYSERSTYSAMDVDLPQFGWVDASEGDYGVSILSNDAVSVLVRESIIHVSAPVPTDGFTYALLPHTGNFRTETVDEAHAVRYPLLSRFVRKGEKRAVPVLPRGYVLASVNDQGLIIDAIKKAENGIGYIVRLYEAFNTRGTATLTLGFDVAEAFETTLLEANIEPLPVSAGGDIVFSYRPFEIKTFRVVPVIDRD